MAIAASSAWYGKPITYPNFKLTSEDLDQYLGVYSSKDIPLKMTIAKNGNTLIAVATRQSATDLSATAKNEFELKGQGLFLNLSLQKKQ